MEMTRSRSKAAAASLLLLGFVALSGVVLGFAVPASADTPTPAAAPAPDTVAPPPAPTAAPAPAPAAAPAAPAPAAGPDLATRVADLEAYVTNGAPKALTTTSGPGHNAWMMTSAALVLFMTLPGLALFYG